MKNVLLIYKGDPFCLPPMMTIIDSLLICGLKVTVIYQELEHNIGKFEKLYQQKGVECVKFTPIKEGDLLLDKISRKYNRDIAFKKKAIKVINNGHYDVLWIIHEFTAILLKDFLKGKKYILSIYELRDSEPKILKGMTAPAQNAKVVVVPEYNRAHMLRCWMKMNRTPIVLPNKPLIHPRTRKIPCSLPKELDEKKIILYQGHITRDRNLDAICASVEKGDNYRVVLMGNGGEYKDYLKEKYPLTVFVDFINPPNHLNFTSHADIAIVTYDYGSLNRLYCAPNKTWEYSGFGIPMLANDIPGLATSVGQYGAATCINMDDTLEIKKAIISILDNYEYYSENANKYFDSIDISSSVKEILEIYLKS